MEDYNIGILKDNIKRIMANKTPKITQAQLSENTGIPQPQISKNLSNNNSNCFTIPQLVAISKYLNISTDELLSTNTNISNASLSVYDVCKMLVKIDYSIPITMEAGNRKGIDIRIKYDEVKDFYDMPQFETEETNVAMMYFFPFGYPSDSIKANEYSLNRACENGYSVRCECSFIGSFLAKYFELRNLYFQNIISEEIFKEIIETHLNQLSKEPIKQYSNNI